MSEESSKSMDRLLEKLEIADPLDKLMVQNLKVGSFFQIGESYYEVKGVSKYVEDEDWEWFELTVFSIDEGRILFFEWEDDDELELCLTTEVKVSVTDVFSSFDAMVSATKTRDRIKYKGKTYKFDEKCTSLFYKEGSERGQKVKMFDFVDGDYGLTIEKWGKGEDDYEISLCKYIEPEDVKVIVL